MADVDSATSLKGLIQGMCGGEVELLRGTVTQASPLRIQIANDSSLVITETNTYVPRHLQDYTTTIDISGGNLNSATATAGSHSHSVSGDASSAADHTHSVNLTTGEDGDPEHTHSVSGNTGSAGSHSHSVSVSAASGGDHTHSLASFTISGAAVTIHNALGEGDEVHVLSLAGGKQYYVLDRV
ncbi:MAG: DUF2577 domain-containing protein [Bacteroidales bacterium]|nr:DUF2577 domain-containing protein [Bacteroidales bacterium]